MVGIKCSLYQLDDPQTAGTDPQTGSGSDTETLKTDLYSTLLVEHHWDITK